jgi:hypothetical protein
VIFFEFEISVSMSNEIFEIDHSYYSAVNITGRVSH